MVASVRARDEEPVRAGIAPCDGHVVLVSFFERIVEGR
jgi:hypothetical protein